MTFIESYDGVRRVLGDPTAFTASGAIDCGQVRPLLPLQAAPDDHLWLRSVLDAVFAGPTIARLDGPLRAGVNGLLDRVATDELVDFNEACSRPFPVLALLTLLDLPRTDLGLLRELHEGLLSPDPAGDPVVSRQEVGARVYDYFSPIVERRMGEPGPDLIRSLGSVGGVGRRLTRDEIVDVCYLLLLAGIDPVSGALANAVALLAVDPDSRAAYLADASSLRRTLEELLRWGCAVKVITRVATQEVDVAGTIIRQSERVGCLLTSANRDPLIFPGPAEFDPDRRGPSHVAFGVGPHRCVGAHLARMELRIVIEELVARFPDFRLDPASAKEIDPANIGANERLPIVLGPSVLSTR